MYTANHSQSVDAYLARWELNWPDRYLCHNKVKPMEAPPDPDHDLPTLDVRSSTISRIPMVSAFSGRQAAGYYDPPHVHDRGQFSYRTEGFARVRAAGLNILLSPGRGVWIPAGVVHEVSCRGPAAYNAFYVDPLAVQQPCEVRVVSISPLLHALVECLVQDADASTTRAMLMANLILEELVRAPDAAAMAPTMPQSPGLRLVCDQLSRQPAMPVDLDTWAASAGMSRRSFTRLFREQTGLSPGEWHNQLRMHFAEVWLAQDVSLQKIAYKLGYASTANFLRARARVFGPSSAPQDA